MAIVASLVATAAAPAKTSHEGWPRITGHLKMNKTDSSRPLTGGHRNDELLGGHGNDTIDGRGGRDVIWGDYKPGGQPASQVDWLVGGAGNDFIYGGHGTNYISAGPGNDWIKTHWGRGLVDCGSGRDVLYISRRAQKHYKVRHCERISHKTLGY